VTLLSSIGFHYYETVNQSLQLQWLDKKKAPQMLGWLLSVGSGATLLAYLLIVLTWRAYDLSYDLVYWVAGGVTVAIALVCFFAFPQFESPNPADQEDGPAAALLAVLRAAIHVGRAAADLRRLRGLHDGGALRFEVHQITALFMGTLLANMIAAPLLGWSCRASANAWR
jgi:hypothetical protein